MNRMDYSYEAYRNRCGINVMLLLVPELLNGAMTLRNDCVLAWFTIRLLKDADLDTMSTAVDTAYAGRARPADNNDANINEVGLSLKFLTENKLLGTESLFINPDQKTLMLVNQYRRSDIWNS